MGFHPMYYPTDESFLYPKGYLRTPQTYYGGRSSPYSRTPLLISVETTLQWTNISQMERIRVQNQGENALASSALSLSLSLSLGKRTHTPKPTQVARLIAVPDM